MCFGTRGISSKTWQQKAFLKGVMSNIFLLLIGGYVEHVFG